MNKISSIWKRVPPYLLKIVIAGIIPIIVFFIVLKVYELSVDNPYTVLSLYFVYIGTILVYYQIKINLNFNKRKAATDFVFNEVTEVLTPLLRELRDILGKKYLKFEPEEDYREELNSGKYDEETKRKLKTTVNKILNFFERMSIAVYKGTYDEDICYDDIGFLMISFYDWTASHVKKAQEDVEERAYFNGISLANKWSKRYQEHSEKIKRNQQRAKKMREKIATIENKKIA